MKEGSKMEEQQTYTKWVLLLLGVWLVVLGGFGVWYFWMSKKGQEYKKEVITQPPRVVEEQVPVKATATPVVREGVVGLQRVTRELKAGGVARVRVVAVNVGRKVMAGDFVFEYDPKVLKFVRISDRAFDDVLMVRDDKKGRVMVSLKSDKGLEVQPQDSLVEVEFKVLKVVPTQVSLEFKGVGKTTDTNLIFEGMAGADGLVNVDPVSVRWE